MLKLFSSFPQCNCYVIIRFLFGESLTLGIIHFGSEMMYVYLSGYEVYNL